MIFNTTCVTISVTCLNHQTHHIVLGKKDETIEHNENMIYQGNCMVAMHSLRDCRVLVWDYIDNYWLLLKSGDLSSGVLRGSTATFRRLKDKHNKTWWEKKWWYIHKEK